MARASRTGVRGLFKGKDGRFRINLRWQEPATGEPRRYRETLPAAIAAAAAKARAREILSSALAGGFEPKRSDEPRTLGKALDEYEAWAETNRPRTLRDRKSYGRLIRAALGENMPLADILPFTLERLKKARKDAKAEPATINRCVKMLKHACGLWAGWGWMPKERAAEVRAVKNLSEPPGRVRYLSPDEEARFMAALVPKDKRQNPALALIATAALQSGMRLAELATLRKDAVDLGAGLITLTRTKANRVRRVFINDALAEVLTAAIASSPEESDHVFLSRLGTPYKPGSLSRLFTKAIRRAGVEDFHFHDCRHSTATRLRAAGVGIDAIAEVLGHSSLAMARRYTHLGPSTLRGAMATLPPPVAPTAPGAPASPFGHPLATAPHAAGENA